MHSPISLDGAAYLCQNCGLTYDVYANYPVTCDADAMVCTGGEFYDFDGNPTLGAHHMVVARPQSLLDDGTECYHCGSTVEDIEDVARFMIEKD